MTREMIIKTAAAELGGYVNTDGEWCSATTPEKFKKFLEGIGFEVISCKETKYSTAIAITADGYRIAYNGHVSKATRQA